jgi:hypothetical protein
MRRPPKKSGQGTPQPPWKIEYVVYLLDPNDASLFTFINSTYGAKRAWQALQSEIEWMRAMRGDVRPIVELDAGPFQTGHGKKIGPIFEPVDWRNFSGAEPAAPQISKPAPAQISGPRPKLAPEGSRATLAQIGRPVEPVTTEEEFDDFVPF